MNNSNIVFTVAIMIAFNSALQRALRDDVKFCPSLPQPWRGVLVTTMALVVEPALTAISTGTSAKEAFMAGLVAAAVPVANGIVAAMATIGPKAAVVVTSIVLFAGCGILPSPKTVEDDAKECVKAEIQSAIMNLLECHIDPPVNIARSVAYCMAQKEYHHVFGAVDCEAAAGQK